MKTIKTLLAMMMAFITIQSVNAQKAKANTGANKAGTVIVTYSCPMHPDITSDKPGKCSVCGTDLGLSKKEILKREVVKFYSCPMHPDVSSDKPGKCSACGMDLGLSKKEILKRKEVKLYTCPMHPAVVSDKPGKCSKCNMDLTKAKDKPGS
jgi:uncharacterized paraquat-inducible protein A